MLVENKFIYLNLPRCASTSFHITCMRKKLDIKYYDTVLHRLNDEIDLTLSNEDIADQLSHTHEKIVDLKRKFGSDIPVIAVRRDKYDRYLSLWKHIIDELHRVGEMEVYEIFKNLTTDELLSYTSQDIVSNEMKYEAIKSFLKRVGSPKHGPYVTAMIYMQMSPTSHYHNHDPNIIWFDIKNLEDLENWVSNKLGQEFRLERVNSSQHFECNIEIDDYFKQKYDGVYDIYDSPKTSKTLL